ncbi:MAG: hypothetical protein QXM02_06770 [Thermoproteota archaeon]
MREMEKIQLSETFPEWPPEKVLSTFINKVIWHDWRGFNIDQQPYEGWVIGYYVSNKYFWMFKVYMVTEDEAKIIKIAKYCFPQGLVPEDEEVKLGRIGYWEVPSKSSLAKFIVQHLPKISCEEE